MLGALIQELSTAALAGFKRVAERRQPKQHQHQHTHKGKVKHEGTVVHTHVHVHQKQPNGLTQQRFIK